MSEQIRRRRDGTIDIASYRHEIEMMRVDYFAEVVRILRAAAPARARPLLPGGCASGLAPLKKI